MLQLNSEQAEALQSIKLERDIARLSDALATAFPDVRARLADRYAALIAHGVERGMAQELDHAVCVARYLACWFMLGAAFEGRPEYTWARDILGAPGRPQGSKVFQLCRRTREELTNLPGATTPAAFDMAISGLDSALMPRGRLGSLLPPVPIQLGDACDLDAIDLRRVEAAPGRQAHRYQLEEGQWRRLPAAASRAPVTLTAGAPTAPRQPPLALPSRLHVLGQPAGRDPSRLRLRTRASRCCDPQVHPLVTLNGPQGVSNWRGAHASDVVFDLYAEPATPSHDDSPQPTIAIETLPQINLLRIESCSLRDAGQVMGDQQTRLAVYPSEQHWMAWRREPGLPVEFPDAAPIPAQPQPQQRPVVFRVERDGLALDGSRWQAGLEDLDRQLAEGLARLATAFERESGVTRGRMACEPAVMSGTAGLTWGWAEGLDGMIDPPYYRLAGQLDLIACQLNLRFSGDLALGGSMSRLSLHCAARAELKLRFERRPSDADLPGIVKPAQVSFRHPFVLRIDALAPAERVALLDAAGPVAGALVGACGLRARKAGSGLQWFCELAIEPVSVALRLNDPLLGLQAITRPLLPALKVLDWSLG